MRYGLISVLICFASSFTLQAAEKPNVLMIVGDDWGWTDFGFMKHPHIKTPHLDRLAREGATFTNGYTPTSLCRASLASIMTGQYGHVHKICCNDPPVGIDRAEMLPFLKNSPTIPKTLGKADYESFQTGKFWEGHFSNGGFSQGMTTKGRHGEEGLVIGRQGIKPITDFLGTVKKPWFIWYAPMMPHEPHTPPERILKKYQQEGRDARLAKYMAMCEWTDETVGDILKHLEEKQLTKNLLIVFVVDNGWVQSEGPVKPKQQFETRSKNTPYDMGVRTPMIFHMPGTIPQGRYTELVSTIDLAPTIYDICQVDQPKKLNGISLMNFMTKKEKLSREQVFGEIYIHTAKRLDDPYANLTHRWIRRGDWKLIVPVHNEGKGELYNLAADPGEKTNLIEEKKEIAQDLTKRLDQQLEGWEKAKPMPKP